MNDNAEDVGHRVRLQASDWSIEDPAYLYGQSRARFFSYVGPVSRSQTGCLTGLTLPVEERAADAEWGGDRGEEC